MLYLLLGINIILMAAGQIFFKKSSIFLKDHQELSILLKYLYNFWFCTGIFIFGIATIVWVKILSLTKLSYVYPMQSVSYVLVAVLAFFIFGEKVSLLNIIGMIIIIFGVFLLSQN
ncbi:MAG: EamA family transporter [Candidatus Nomurabacteria bacterium]|nr:EamA family transporter [Candidatus Nomurabacteria bacterium]